MGIDRQKQVITFNQKVPGPETILGGMNFYKFFRSPLDYISSAAHEYGDVAWLNISRRPTYLLSNPDDIRDVLVTHHRNFVKSPFLQQTRAILGDGLLTSEGDLHLRQRRLIQPAFHHQRVASYGQVMVENAEKTSRQWQDGQVIDLSNEMMRLTMSIVAQSLFGSSIEGRANEIGEAITTMMVYSNRLNLPFWNEVKRLPFSGNQQMEAAGERIDRMIQEMIAQRRAHPSTEQNDLLGMLLAAREEGSGGKGMTDQQLRDEVVTLFLAGHETTAVALTWAFTLISTYPWVEQKLHAEIDEVLQGRTPTTRRLRPVDIYTPGISGIDALVPPCMDYRTAGSRGLPCARVYAAKRVRHFNEPMGCAP